MDVVTGGNCVNGGSSTVYCSRSSKSVTGSDCGQTTAQGRDRSVVIVSACLIGVCCRYDGGSSLRDHVVGMMQSAHLIPVCPEQLGGLATPRIASEISCGDGLDVLDGRSSVVTSDGDEVTEEFVRGAEQCLYVAEKMNARKAILKEKSPSCGVESIYRRGQLVKGMGVTTALLKRHGIDVDGA